MELFFKALEQNLRIKTFVGTTANAQKIQVWTAVTMRLPMAMIYAAGGGGAFCEIQ